MLVAIYVFYLSRHQDMTQYPMLCILDGQSNTLDIGFKVQVAIPEWLTIF